MKKLLLTLLGIFSLTFAQAQYSNYSCDDLLNDIKYEGSWQGSESSYSSSAIRKIKWYEYNDRYFALVQFAPNVDRKVYVYGNWSYYEYSKIKRGFRRDKYSSYGKAFHAWIQPNSRVGCRTNKSYL